MSNPPLHSLVTSNPLVESGDRRIIFVVGEEHGLYKAIESDWLVRLRELIKPQILLVREGTESEARSTPPYLHRISMSP
ncbi:MAG: hypothetical protein ACD_21C00202G0007 [uncultured bacterium]|nr:MAG: hypothetical protein ACD_21C00202G0007 [uncultured bacterium]